MKKILFVCLAIFSGTFLLAQPTAGDVFREYVWLPDMVFESEKFLRVGGRLGYETNPEHFPPGMHSEGHIPLKIDFDLENAVKCELVLEKVQSHEDTKGLKVQINNKKWLDVPDAEGIPAPQSAYMHHFYPVVVIPLEFLNEGTGNTIKLKVDPRQKWDWPQNLFYGFIFRIYYRIPITLNAPVFTYKVTPETIKISLMPHIAPDKVSRVEFIGKFEDYNFEGDGIFRQWKYHYHRGRLMNHIGTVTEAPYKIAWDISWLPDQKDPVLLGARIVDKEGLIHFIQFDDPLVVLERPGSVKLYRTQGIPLNFVTRENEFTTTFYINENLDEALAWQIAWVSWSPGYANGIFVNDHEILHTEGPKYAYYIHKHEYRDISILKQGRNEIKTGKTPFYEGVMVHGMEVQWPGFMIKVKYQK